ncbi:subunit gamma of vesicle coat complex [Ordospora colligata]|nr:subunit gamma of vesicle coat complex [Ordospora colligata]
MRAKTKVFAPLSEQQLLEEMRDSFDKSPIVTRSAMKAINSLVHMLSVTSISEASIKEAYITLLKGFQSKDIYLKAGMYSAIDELSRHFDEGLVAANILMNDLNGKISDDMKAMALKTLFCILPADMIYDFGKYVSQAFVSPSVIRRDMAVLVSCKLLRDGFSEVKEWIDDVDSNDDSMTSYHAARFLMQTRKLRLGIVESLRGPSGIIGARVVVEQAKSGNSEALAMLKKLLGSKYSDEMVFIEAAKGVCVIGEEYASQLVQQTVQSLRIFLKSTNIALQFSAMRIISGLALRYPHKTSIANKEVEDLVMSENKTISMFAITSLLKTGTEETIDRLVKLIPGMIAEMSDGLKKIAIETLETLSNTFESKKPVFIDFLSSALSQKGGLEFKKYIVSVISRVVSGDDVRDRVLEFLCTYAEDSQYYQITLDILGIFGQEIPKSKVPGKYVVHVLNRLILENNHVRAAALQCLYDISHVVSIDTVEGALRKSLDDRDEMVRGISLFLLQNLRLAKSCQPFMLDELGDLKEAVLEHLGQKEEHEECKDKLFIKECREVTLTEDASDVRVSVVKRMYENKVVLIFSIENIVEGIQICNGILSFATTGANGRSEGSIKIDQIAFGEVKVFETECSVEEECVINGVLEYTMCSEKDVSDTETDSVTLKPFQITIMDFVRPLVVKNASEVCKKAVFGLQGDVYVAGKKILDLLNMKMAGQEVSNNTMEMQLTGQYYKIPIEVRISITNSGAACKCIADVYCSDEEIGTKITKLFD